MNQKRVAMKIGIDLRQLTLGISGGISQLVKGVCEHVFNLYPEHQFFVFCTPFNRSLLEYEGEHVCYFSLSLSSYFNELDQIMAQKGLDILFRTYPMEDILQFPLHQQIFLIPDNQHETHPEFFTKEVLRTRRMAFAQALGRGGAVGAISEFARKELRNFSETRCKDIFLMEPALQVAHRNGNGEAGLDDSEKAMIPNGAFFLFPANIWKHKNHSRLLQAFDLLRKKTELNISLVLTGHPNGWSELSNEFSTLQDVMHLGFVRPELLRVLFERARALVFFSLYEGFGMPLLEAFDAETPVLCSNTTSLPEVGGDAVLTCDPTDVNAIAGLMERILVDDRVRAQLIQRGKLRLNVYSWEKSAHSFVAACDRIVSRGVSSPETFHKVQEPLPLVSIITPSYNQGRFLKKTIESVLTQSYPNIEYLVIDGGSNDESVEILRSYGDRFYWLTEKDRGQTDAINKGMARAKGDILAYLNSDDVLVPGAIERVVSFFQRNPDCDLVYGNANYIDENDNVSGHYKTAHYSYNRLLEDCMICQPAAFWKRKIAEHVGAFDEDLNYVMDYDYWLRIAKANGDIRFLPVTLANSRLYPETKTQSARSKIFKEIFKICRKHAGYVHLSYYKGYWHYLIFEKNSITSRALRRFPRWNAKLSWLHHKWKQRDRYSLSQVCSFVTKRAFSILAVFFTKIPGIRPLLSLARVNVSIGSIVGFWPDNWIEPTLMIPSKKRSSGTILYFGGVSSVDLRMEICVRDVRIHQFDFKAHQYKKVTFLADVINDERVAIRFSNSVKDAANRHLSFLLQDTNVFSEQDLWG
jgi:glycosyltransferase involved in cell wall biosynthesis